MARSCDDGGFLTVQFMLAVGLSLVMLASLANLLVQRYAVAAVQAALEEGVRAGSRADSRSADCAQRIRDTVRSLLGGRYGRGVRIACARNRTRVHAEARASFAGWAPFVPDLAVRLSARAVRESP